MEFMVGVDKQKRRDSGESGLGVWRSVRLQKTCIEGFRRQLFNDEFNKQTPHPSKYFAHFTVTLLVRTDTMGAFLTGIVDSGFLVLTKAHENSDFIFVPFPVRSCRVIESHFHSQSNIH